jgi:hypothetical protein
METRWKLNRQGAAAQRFQSLLIASVHNRRRFDNSALTDRTQFKRSESCHPAYVFSNLH